MEVTLKLIQNKTCFSRKALRRQQIFETLVSMPNGSGDQRRAEVLLKKFWPEEKIAKRGAGSGGLEHDQDAKVRGAIRNIREDLAKFFNKGAGKDHSWAIRIDDYSWEIRLVPNRPQQEGEDLLKAFWAPHLRGQTTLLYPTPPFFEDDKQTFLRNLNAVDERTARKVFSYLNGAEFSSPDLRIAFQWTPIGSAVSMVRIAQCLQRLGQQA